MSEADEKREMWSKVYKAPYQGEDVDWEDIELGAAMYDQLQAGTFYDNQQKAYEEMFGKGKKLKFVGEEDKP